MKNSIKLAGLACLLSAIFVFASSFQKNINGNRAYESECLGIELDGSQTLKAWGEGRSRKDAVEQAKKNAVRDVLFKGIRNGSSDCNLKPVIFEVNARDKYEDYFNKFFADGGEYAGFVSMKDEPLLTKFKKDKNYAADNQKIFGVIVRIKRAELKAKMIKDNIINNQ